MSDRTVILAACFEALHPVESASPAHLAQLASCTTTRLVVVLDNDKRFTRVAGEGCWWWKLADRTMSKAERRRHDDITLAAHRATVVHTRRIREALASQGGMTISRIADVTGLDKAEIERALVGLQSGREVETFTIPGMDGHQFWKASAA